MSTVNVLSPVVQCRHGQRLSLSCQFRAVPTPTVWWLKNGQMVLSGHDSRLHISTSHDDADEDAAAAAAGVSIITSDLVIEQTSLRDSGMYQCRAVNIVGVAVMTSWVDIVITG